MTVLLFIKGENPVGGVADTCPTIFFSDGWGMSDTVPNMCGHREQKLFIIKWNILDLSLYLSPRYKELYKDNNNIKKSAQFCSLSFHQYFSQRQVYSAYLCDT